VSNETNGVSVDSDLDVRAGRAQQHNIDTQKSTLTIHVGKTGVFSGLGREHGCARADSQRYGGPGLETFG